MKLKKQFRLYDIYRYHTIGRELGEIPNVIDIETFYLDTKLTLMQVNGRTYVIENGEEGLREIVKMVNKMLGNCEKPGRKFMKNTLYSTIRKRIM